MKICRHVTWLNDTNMYLAIDEASGHALLIDPSDEETVRRAASDGITIDYILLTHEHYDHISALNQIRRHVSAKVAASSKCSAGIQSSRDNMSRFFDVIGELTEGADGWNSGNFTVKPYRCAPADIVFDGDMTIEWKGHSISLHEAPGHSRGGTLINIDGEYLFSGDTISYDYELITGFPGGSGEDYSRITEPLIRSFNGNIKVYPGHGRDFLLKDVLTRQETENQVKRSIKH